MVRASRTWPGGPGLDRGLVGDDLGVASEGEDVGAAIDGCVSEPPGEGDDTWNLLGHFDAVEDSVAAEDVTVSMIYSY